MWLGGLFIPEAYITASRQYVAQANSWSLEELYLDVQVHAKPGEAKLDDCSFGITGTVNSLKYLVHIIQVISFSSASRCTLVCSVNIVQQIFQDRSTSFTQATSEDHVFSSVRGTVNSILDWESKDAHSLVKRHWEKIYMLRIKVQHCTSCFKIGCDLYQGWGVTCQVITNDPTHNKDRM